MLIFLINIHLKLIYIQTKNIENKLENLEYITEQRYSSNIYVSLLLRKYLKVKL